MDWKKRIISATIATSLLVPMVTFADTDASATEKLRVPGKLNSIISYKSLERGLHVGKMGELSEEVKSNMEELKSKFDANEITHDELMEQIKAQLPEDYNFKKPVRSLYLRPEVSEELKVKIEELRAQLESEEITREEFQEEMKELMPEGAILRIRGKGLNIGGEISEELKVKIEELRAKLESEEITREEFKEEMKELMPEGAILRIRGKGLNVGREISEELKVKLEELRAKLESEEITREEFKEEMMLLMPRD